MWLSPKIPYPASPPPSRPNRRSPALRRRPAVIQPTSSGERRVPSPPLSETGIAPDHPYQRTAVVCPPPKGCPQVAAYAALPAHENLQYDIPPHTSLPSPTHPFSNQLCGASAPTPGGFPSKRPLIENWVKGKAGMGGREIQPAQVLERCARWPEVYPVDLSFVRPLLGGLVVRRPGRGAADNKRGDYSRAHESPCGRPRGYAQGRLDSH